MKCPFTKLPLQTDFFATIRNLSKFHQPLPRDPIAPPIEASCLTHTRINSCRYGKLNRPRLNWFSCGKSWVSSFFQAIKKTLVDRPINKGVQRSLFDNLIHRDVKLLCLFEEIFSFSGIQYFRRNGPFLLNHVVDQHLGENKCTLACQVGFMRQA